MSSYTSLYGTTDVNADTLNIQQLSIQSNPLSIAGYNYYFPNINDIIATETKAQSLSSKTITASTINGTTIGATTPADGTFVNLAATTLNTTTANTTTLNTTTANTTTTNATTLNTTNTNTTTLTNTYRLQINNQEVVLANLFDKTTDTTDAITEGATNRFDHITVSSPLSRTLDNLTIATASAIQAGSLSSADWSIFNAKENVLSFSAPLSRVANTISIPKATIAQDGYLSAADFATFSAGSTLWYNVSILGNARIENTNSLNLKTGTGIAIKSGTIAGGIWAVNSSNVHTASEFYNENLSFSVSSAGATLLSSINTGTGAFCDNSRNITINSITHTDTSVILSATRDLSVAHAYVNGGLSVSGMTSSVFGYSIGSNTVIDASRNVNCQSLLVNGSTLSDVSRNLYANYLTINGSAAITDDRTMYAKELFVNGSLFADLSRNVNANQYSINGSVIIDVNRYCYFNYVYMGGYLAIDANRNFTGLSVNISDVYLIGGKYALDTRGTDVVMGAQDLNTTIYHNGSYNFFAGRQAGQTYLNAGYSASHNVGIGNLGTLTNLTNGSYNVAIGTYACQSLSTGQSNVGVGYGVLYNVGSGSTNNTGVGMYAQYSRTGDQYGNCSVGYASVMYGSGSYNAAMGYQAMYDCGAAGNCVAIGNSAYVLGKASEAVAVGASTLSVSTGAADTAIGSYCMAANTTGDYNTGVGHSCLRLQTTGFQNVAMGFQALYANTSGAYNTAIGYASLNTPTTATGNTAVGHDTQVIGNYPSNTVIGSNNYSYATANVSVGSGNRTGYNSYQCLLGSAINVPSLSDDLTYGYYANQNMASVSSGSYLVIKTNGRFGPLVSSRKFKTKIRPLVKEIDPFAVLKLEAVLYQPLDEVGNDRVIGFVAEDADKHVPELVIKKSDGTPFSFDYARVCVLLVEVVKELNERLKHLTKKLDETQKNETMTNIYTW